MTLPIVKIIATTMRNLGNSFERCLFYFFFESILNFLKK